MQSTTFTVSLKLDLSLQTGTLVSFFSDFCPIDLCPFSFGSYSFNWPWDVLFKWSPTPLITNYILKRFWIHICSLENLSPAVTLTGLLELGENLCKWHFSSQTVSLNGIYDEPVITPELLVCKAGREQAVLYQLPLSNICLQNEHFFIECFSVNANAFHWICPS